MKNPGLNILNYPILTFIDGFGIYRNARRLIIGMYQLPASLLYSSNSKGKKGKGKGKSNKQGRNANIFPIILRPHTINFNAIINTIGYFILLDQGIIIEIYRKPTLVLIFTIYYIRDIL